MEIIGYLYLCSVLLVLYKLVQDDFVHKAINEMALVFPESVACLIAALTVLACAAAWPLLIFIGKEE